MLGPSLRMKKNESTPPWKLYMYLYTFVVLTFIFGLSYFNFCVLLFMYQFLSSERFLSFIVFCLLHFKFWLFTFVFCV